ncbi:MAG TPA: PH domain-containing protein [Candidatus Paceibacterota bacterium]|nr:PH domain-containing protein [Candidatus Paceibacterota bacterium]
MEEFALEPGEKVTLSVRKHWFLFLVQLLPFALLAYLPLIFPDFIEGVSNAAPQAALGLQGFTVENPWFRLGLGAWWLILWILAFNVFTSYFLNLWIITTTRIVHIRQYGFFSRQVSSFLLSHIQDVTTTVDGFFATLLNYGSVRAETAGDASACFRMTGMPDPTGIRDLIMKEIADLHLSDSPPNPKV